MASGFPKSIDQYLDRNQTANYNCLDFVREVWLDMFAIDVTDRLKGLVGAFANRRANLSGVKSFKRIFQPENPCFVVMQRFKYVPHCGIYLDGRILHLKPTGVEFQPLVVARAYFTSIRWYEGIFK